ncbi:hypothetical protein JCM3770_000737 [Rhodotorula araucariae]
MRIVRLCCALVVCIGLGLVVVAAPAPLPLPLPNQNRRVGVAFGSKDANLAIQRDRDTGRAAIPAAKDAGHANYLVTLDRGISNVTKDKVLDLLLRLGAVVKQEYDYRVYKGVLFTVPAAHDHGLESWQTSLIKLAGVKYVEEDTLVTTQPVADKAPEDD